jgi:hypothetical protein
MKKKQPRVRSPAPKSEIRPQNKTPSVRPSSWDVCLFVGLFVFLSPKCGTSKCRAQPAGQHVDVACVWVMSGTRARATYNCRARKRSLLRAASERARERATRAYACGSCRSLARTQSSVDRGVFFWSWHTTLFLHCTRFEHTTGFVFESSLPGTVRPDCASTFWTVQIVGGGEEERLQNPWRESNTTQNVVSWHFNGPDCGREICRILSFRSVGCLLYLHLCGQFLLCSLVLGLVGPLGISASLSSHNHPTRNNGFCAPFVCLFVLKSP